MTSYRLMNILAILAAVLLFICGYGDLGGLFSNMGAMPVAVVLVTAALVHMLKAGRLYFALYGAEFKKTDYIKTYCKVTPVSMIFPFKLGEIFRMYCYGQVIGSTLKGVVIILFDRFVDTTALISIILFIWMLEGIHIAPFYYVLLLFLVIVFIIYFVFPGIYRFWKEYLLKADATEHRLKVLKFLERFNDIYREAAGIVNGRGIILYFMSLVAWGLEIISLCILSGIIEEGGMYQMVSDYLTSALGGVQSTELKRFIVVSVTLLTGMYIIIKISGCFHGKGQDNEGGGHL